MDYVIACTLCDSRYDSKDSIFRCRKCNGILEVSYNYSQLKLKNFKKEKISYKKYLPFYPIDKKILSLGEGSTELISSPDRNSLFDDHISLYLKIETENPTKSFKDRGSAIEITKAIELGFEGVCCASTGNMGLSVARYARNNKLDCTIFISKKANPEKIKKIEVEKANIVKVDGDYNKAVRLAEKFVLKEKLFLCGDYHYRKEGQKSIMFEIIEQTGYKIPDYIFIQVGNGTLFAAAYKALKEFKRFKLIKKMPRLVAVQSEECNPLVRAYLKESPIRYQRPRTYADAIAVGYPTFGFESIKAIRETKGYAVAVSDKDIAHSRFLLSRKLELESEPGGAVGLAGILKSYSNNKAKLRNKCVVAIITGNNED